MSDKLFMVTPDNTRQIVINNAAEEKPLFIIAQPIHRFAAFIIDFFIVLWPIMYMVTSPLKRKLFEAWITNDQGTTVVIGVAYLSVCLLTIFLYQSLFHRFLGATVGKLFFHLRVQNIWSRKPLTLSQSMLRSFSWICEICLLGLPVLSLFAHERRRLIHDRVSESIVVSVRSDKSAEPSAFEMGLFRGAIGCLMLFFIAFSFIHLLNGMDLVRRHKSLWDGLEAAIEDCSKVSRALQQARVKLGHNPNALEIAMALYAAGELPSSCLWAEAQNTFHRSDDRALAYLAGAFVHADEAELSNQYLAEACREEPESSACAISKIVDDWSGGNNVGEKSDDIINSDPVRRGFAFLRQRPELYVRVWSIRHFYNYNAYDDVLAEADRLAGYSGFSPFLTRFLVKAYLGKYDLQTAKAIGHANLASLPELQKKMLYAHICYEDVHRFGTADCQKIKSDTCQNVLDLTADSNQPDPRVDLLRLDLQHCSGGNRVLASELSLPESVALAEVETMLTSNPLDVEARLLEIASSSDYANEIKGEARRRWLERAKGRQIKAYAAEFKTEARTSEWIKTGLRLFEVLLAAKLYIEAEEVVQTFLPAISAQSDVVSQVLHLAIGHKAHKMAWNLLQQESLLFLSRGAESSVNKRAPASDQSLTQLIKQLRQKYGGSKASS